MGVQTGRTEKRLAMAFPIWLTSLEQSGPFERAITENVSPAGARIVAGTRWQPGDHVVVWCSPGCITHALVVYSQLLTAEGGQFAVGVRLQDSPRTWPVRVSGDDTH